MSMPIITIPNKDWDKTLSNTVASVALQEAAISRILNAKGEKIQASLNLPKITADNLSLLNQSVERLVKLISTMQKILLERLSLCSAASSTPTPPNTPLAPAP